jgi:hypothetical protein
VGRCEEIGRAVARFTVLDPMQARP